MKRSTSFHYQPEGPVRLSHSAGTITIKDSSNQTVSIYCGPEAINKLITDHLNGYYVETANLNTVIERYLLLCSRGTQEKFMQVMSDHIRKLDNAAAE
tara:strand:- start:175 stop:468 length:294 start_codon:yes stop_codon:yes gene_type:complete